MNKPKRMPLFKLLELEAHPFADLFPMASDDEIEGIAEGMAEHGFRADRAILIFEGKLLDGRNRRKALERAIEIKGSPISGYFLKFEGTTQQALDFVLSENLHRRHLTTSQRALIAANLAHWELGMNQHSEGSENLPTQGETAKSLSISDRALRSAKAIKDRGSEALTTAVQSGDLTIHTASALIELGDKDLAQVLAQDHKSVIQKAKEIRTANQRASRDQNTAKLNKIAAKGSGLVETLPTNAYPILVADPPWKNEVWGEDTGNEKSPPYPTMELDAIKALCADDNSPATKSALLFLWATNNRLADGIDVLRAWGFEYSTSYVWDKVNIGMGRRVRDRHEHLLIGVRGGIHAPEPSALKHSVKALKKTAHSVKPDWFSIAIDEQYPDLPKLELFQREKALSKNDIRLHTRNKGRWSFWGNESGGA